MAPSSTSTPELNIQGLVAANTQVDPKTFFRFTRRQRGKVASSIASYQGLGNDDTLELKQAGILAAIDVKFTGALTVTPGTGTVATTAAWPYSLFKNIRVSANGQSNLISASGLMIRAREFIGQPGLTDNGVQQTVGGVVVDQGTLSYASESWGVGQSTTAIAAGTYDVVLSLRIPIAWDLTMLYGSLFLQTTSTSVDTVLQWANQSDLFVLTGDATVALTGGLIAEGVVFTIPSVAGQAVVPDLSAFHAFTEGSTTDIGLGSNETVLIGQGVNKQLMRILGRLTTGAPGVPVVMDASNYGQIGWGYGLNEDPEVWQDGDAMRIDIERRYGVDMYRYGLSVIDFAQHWAFRDSVDEGSATQLRLLNTLVNAPSGPRYTYVQETMIQAAAAA